MSHTANPGFQTSLGEVWNPGFVETPAYPTGAGDLRLLRKK